MLSRVRRRETPSPIQPTALPGPPQTSSHIPAPPAQSAGTPHLHALPPAAGPIATPDMRNNFPLPLDANKGTQSFSRRMLPKACLGNTSSQDLALLTTHPSIVPRTDEYLQPSLFPGTLAP